MIIIGCIAGCLVAAVVLGLFVVVAASIVAAL